MSEQIDLRDSQNLAIGKGANALATDGKNNVVIGIEADASSFSNCVLIGHGVKADRDNQVKIGNTEITATGEISTEVVRKMVDTWFEVLAALDPRLATKSPE